jgi:predicted CopG family antitoxin
MEKTISISDDLYRRLESLAIPFEDKEPGDVIKRLVDSQIQSNDVLLKGKEKMESEIITRAPRERGVVVELDGERITASTIPDLSKKIMIFIDDKGKWKEFEKLAPYATSSKRFLISDTPIHPNGNNFVVPIKYKDIYMEAHKNYDTAIKQLKRILDHLDIVLRYIN